ncbi:hypothetical protein [Krasilnikovia sp. MM14-A1004]|uniref:hypothetical protein n=1 Tax=Krasilnikovia sp. MM14-A1004 TaxID=3373541 RepID=UPI00399CAE54
MINRYTAPVFAAPDRFFQVMRTSRTHTQLWLQSDAAPDSGHPLRLEVLFQWVHYMCLPFTLRGLTVRAATPAERDRLAAAHGLEVSAEQGVYLLSEEHDWFVVASGSPLWAEARLSYSDESVFWDHAADEDVVVSVATMA